MEQNHKLALEELLRITPDAGMFLFDPQGQTGQPSEKKNIVINNSLKVYYKL